TLLSYSFIIFYITWQPPRFTLFPYTTLFRSLPKGCMHINRTIQANTIGSFYWGSLMPDAVVLGTLPLFHVTGLIHSVLAPILARSEEHTSELQSRFDIVCRLLLEKKK